MKRIYLIALCLMTYTLSRAQGVADTNPNAQIFAIDYQSGQQYPATSDQAIMFKDAFVDLVRNTNQSRQMLRMSPGRKTAVIKQINPQKLNGYQLTWQTTVFGQVKPVCTFYYNIDENSLYFFDQGSQNWVGVQIDPDNQPNLDNCKATCHFNSQQGGVPDLSANSGQGLPDLSTLPDTTGQGIDEEVTANEAPPALPEYDQPDCPADGYLWQPGYWAYSPVAADYYWVPGVWVAPPSPDLYWTPGYWGFVGGIYRFHVGYWGHSVGFYGGINYGFGYIGIGYVGGEWRSGHFAYNTAVVHVNTIVVHNTYINTTVIHNTTIVNNRTSFNGQGGINARPTPAEQAAMHEQHVMPTKDQIVHQQAALGNKGQFANSNHGKPSVATMAKVQPEALNKGNGPAVNSNNRNTNRQPGNANTPGQGTRNFNNSRQPAGNQQNTNHQPADNNTPNNGNSNQNNRDQNTRQPATTNNDQQNNDRGTRPNNQPAANSNNPSNNGNTNQPNKNNQQQTANNGQRNNGKKPGGQHQNKVKPPQNPHKRDQ